MKISKKELRKIVKEELEEVYNPNANRMENLVDKIYQSMLTHAETLVAKLGGNPEQLQNEIDNELATVAEKIAWTASGDSFSSHDVREGEENEDY